MLRFPYVEELCCVTQARAAASVSVNLGTLPTLSSEAGGDDPKVFSFLRGKQEEDVRAEVAGGAKRQLHK